MKNSTAIFVLMFCGGLGGCATTDMRPFAAMEPETPRPPPPSSATDGQPTFQLERYIGVDSSGWPNPDQQGSFSDLYTRLELHSDSYRAGATPSTATAINTVRDYEQEKRGWLPQLLSSETDSVTTLASVQVANPELKVSVPLFSITHASSSGLGNTWTTNFTSSDVQSPLFLVGPNTALTIDLSAKVSQDLKSQGTSVAVNAITQAVKIANPSAALLTTLSSSTVNSAATAIDTAISGLLTKDIAEDIQLGRFANSWDQNSQFVIYGCSPFARSEQSSDNSVCGQKLDIDGGMDVEVGQWTLSLTCPRLSVFDSRDICGPIGSATPQTSSKMLSLAADAIRPAKEAIAADVTDNQVLQFPLSSQVTVSAFSQSQTWFTTFATAIGNPSKTPDYGAFCGGAVSAFETSGLSRFDAEMALRSLIRSLGQFSSVRSQFTANGKGKDCMTYVPSKATGFQ